jgi:peroxiredoxin
MIRKARTALAFGLGLAALALTAAAGPGDTATTAKIGEKAPAWKLTDLDGKTHELKDFKGKNVVLEWTNPDCPFIVAVYEKGVVKETLDAMKKMGDDFVYIAVNSTANKPMEEVKKINVDFLKKHETKLPVVMDYDGKVGKAYGAKRTPHMFVIDGEGVLRYHGAFTDDQGSRKAPNHTNYVLGALKQIAAGETVTPDHVREWGCTVKYAN